MTKKNQRGSKQSHSMLIVFGRSLNQRVAGSNPARLTKILNIHRLFGVVGAALFLL
jgi:hypothetical protein